MKVKLIKNMLLYSVLCSVIPNFVFSKSSNDSLENLNYVSYKSNEIFIQDNIKELPGIFPVSDTWFTRENSYRQAENNYLSFQLDNVNLNSIIDGTFRNSQIFNNFSVLSISSRNNNIFNNSYSLQGFLNASNKFYDSTFLKVIFQGGNIFGSTSLEFNGKYKFLRWISKIDYLVSGGFDISSSKPDSLNLSRENTGLNKFGAQTGFLVGDSKSSISLFGYFAQGSQNYPYNIIRNSAIYLKESESRQNLFNLKFNSEINYNLNLKGNLFYVRDKYIIERFDDNLMNSKILSSSFTKAFEEFKYGWNSAIDFAPDENFILSYTFNYAREALNYQPNSGFLVKKYEIEKAATATELKGSNEYFDYFIDLGYRLLNPLTAYSDKMLESFSDFEYAFGADIKILNSIVLKGSVTRNIMLPQMYLIYSELNPIDLSLNKLESTINNSFEIETFVRLDSNNSVSLKYFSSTIRNIAPHFSYIEYDLEKIKFTKEINGLEFSSFLNLDLFQLNLKADYNFNRNSIFNIYGQELTLPKMNFKINIFDKYDFGFNWRINSFIMIDKISASDQPNNSRNILILNANFGMEVFKNNEIFLNLNNFLDEYYEIISGMPMHGINFWAGIKLIL